jgi:succinate dehydrogenase hydrophobic anchor subunit
MTRLPAATQSTGRRFRQVLSGVAAIVCLTAVFFAVLHWRINTPESHLNFGNQSHDRLTLPNHE